MDLNSVGTLIQKIMINYPSAKNQFLTKEGKISLEAAQEWHRIIGYLDLEEAIARLDAWMEGPDNAKPPRAADFKKARAENRQKYYSEGIGPYMVNGQGDLVNEAGMRFAFPDSPDAKYQYSQNGICRQGSPDRAAIPWQEINRRKWLVEQLEQKAKETKNG